jgi:hypothetical protein
VERFGFDKSQFTPGGDSMEEETLTNWKNSIRSTLLTAERKARLKEKG